MKDHNTVLMSNGEVLHEIKIKQDIFQGDSLYTGVYSIDPNEYVTKDCECGIQVWPEGENH